MKTRPPRTLSEVAFLNLRAKGVKTIPALRQAARALEPVAALAIAARLLGHWPTQAEYAEVSGIDERTAQREWRAFRNAFPGEDSPDRLARLVFAEMQGREDRTGAVLSFPAPADLVPA